MTDRTTRVRLEAITGQYEAAMARAGLSTKSLGHTIDDIGTRSDGSFKKVGLSLANMGDGAVGAIAGVALLGVALLKMTKDGVDSYVHLVDEVMAYQRVTGASAEESSKMIAIAHALGVENDVVAAGMFRLSRQVSSHAAVLEADGVAIARTSSGQVDLSKTLENVGVAYRKAGAGAAGNQVIFDAFGRSGLRMIPILKQSTSAIEELWATAKEHHEVVTEADIAAVFQYHVATRELGEAWTGLERTLGKDAVPALAAVAGWLTTATEKTDDWTTSIWNAVRGDDGAATAADKRAAADQRAADAKAKDKAEIDGFTAALKVLAAEEFSVQEAGDKVESSLIAFADATRAAQIGGDKFATSLQAGSIEGNKNRASLIAMTKGALDVAQAMKEQHASQDQINVAMIVYRERLIETLGQLGFNRQEVGSYVDTLLQIPGNLGTVITADTSQAEQALARVLSILGAIQRAETFTNLNVLSGRTVAPVVDTGGGTTLADAIGGRGPQATQARTAAAAGGRSAADDAKAAHDAYLSADDAFNKSMFDHHMKSSAEYEAYLDERIAMETKFSQGWFALLDERQRVEDQKASDEKAWNDKVAENRANDIKAWMDTANAEYQTGVLSRQQYREILVARLADLTKYSADYMDVWNQIHQIDEQNVADQEALLQRQQQASDQAAQQRTDALGRLNSLLDDAAKLHKQQEDLEAAHRQKMADIQAGFIADQQKIIDDRRGQLLEWAHIDEQVTVGWGTSIAALASNVHDQMDVFNEWVMALAQARSRGVSDQVISLLGLDQGPEALGQLRMFTSATDGEIADLNDAVAARTKQAGDRVTDETTQSFTKVAGLLKDLAEKHAAEIEKLTEDFLAQERSLTDQLKALGTDAGRSWADAIAAGIMSGIPGLVAAAQAAQAAITASNAAKDLIVRGQNPGNLKDVAPGTKGVTLTPAINVGGTTVQVGVSFDGKALDGAFDVRVKDKNTRASLARVN